MIVNYKKYKIIYKVYNFFQKRHLKHNLPFYKKYNINKKYYSSISSQDFIGLKEELNIYDLENSKDLLKQNPEFLKLSDKRQKEISNWSEDGYAIMDSFFSEQEVELINSEVKHLIDSEKIANRYNGRKYMFANRVSGIVSGIGNGNMRNIVEILLSRKVELFQTINFEKGSEQRAHSDSIHMSTFPKGNLIATWVALQDITVDDGPLFFYPKSHKLPYIDNSDFDNLGTKRMLGKHNNSVYEDKIQEVLTKSNLEKKLFLAKKGDVLIWHANLLHGGSEIMLDSKSRLSMVFHYYANDAICYHEVTQRPTLKRVFRS